jgi:16S rRNA (cytidine1402-2'-O)-methyltransferase
MSLTLVATPIGNPEDLSMRGLATLKSADIIILEEFKESTTLLRAHGITGKTYEQLNEHSKADDLARLVNLCRDKNVALITDCGTPGFADPGTDLVRECRKNNIPIKSLPGASSLMTLLSLSSQRLDQFLFRGFVPAETEARRQTWKNLQTEKRAIVLMDTPYRLGKMMGELKEFFPNRRILLALDMTQDTEQILEGLPSEVQTLIQKNKAEFMILVYP